MKPLSNRSCLDPHFQLKSSNIKKIQSSTMKNFKAKFSIKKHV